MINILFLALLLYVVTIEHGCDIYNSVCQLTDSAYRFLYIPLYDLAYPTQ